MPNISWTIVLWENMKLEENIPSTSAYVTNEQHQHKWRLELEDGKVSSLSCKLCEEYVDDATLVFGSFDVTVKYHTEVYTSMNSISPEYDYWIEVKNDNA